MKSFVLALVGGCALTLAGAGGAMADSAASTACAAKLTPNGRMIYDATLPQVKPGVVIKDALRNTAKPMVMGGKMSRDEAKEAAEPAGKCLQLLLQ